MSFVQKYFISKCVFQNHVCKSVSIPSNKFDVKFYSKHQSAYSVLQLANEKVQISHSWLSSLFIKQTYCAILS